MRIKRKHNISVLFPKEIKTAETMRCQKTSVRRHSSMEEWNGQLPIQKTQKSHSIFEILRMRKQNKN